MPQTKINNKNSFWNFKPVKAIKIKPFLNLNSYPKRTKQEIRLIDRNPFGDKDKDRVPNWFDCRPLNKSKQGFLESPKKKRNIEQVKRRIDELSMLVPKKGQRLIVDKGIVKGSVLYGVNKKIPGETYLMGIDILPKEQRKGYGRKVIESIFKDKRVKRLYGISFPKAKGFYKKLGATFDTGQMKAGGKYHRMHLEGGFEIKKEDFEKATQDKKIKRLGKRASRPTILASLPEEKLKEKSYSGIKRKRVTEHEQHLADNETNERRMALEKFEKQIEKANKNITSEERLNEAMDRRVEDRYSDDFRTNPYSIKIGDMYWTNMKFTKQDEKLIDEAIKNNKIIWENGSYIYTDKYKRYTQLPLIENIVHKVPISNEPLKSGELSGKLMSEGKLSITSEKDIKLRNLYEQEQLAKQNKNTKALEEIQKVREQVLNEENEGEIFPEFRIVPPSERPYVKNPVRVSKITPKNIQNPEYQEPLPDISSIQVVDAQQLLDENTDKISEGIWLDNPDEIKEKNPEPEEMELPEPEDEFDNDENEKENTSKPEE